MAALSTFFRGGVTPHARHGGMTVSALMKPGRNSMAPDLRRNKWGKPKCHRLDEVAQLQSISRGQHQKFSAKEKTIGSESENSPLTGFSIDWLLVSDKA